MAECSLFFVSCCFLLFLFLKTFFGLAYALVPSWFQLWWSCFPFFFLLKIAFRIRNPARGSIYDLAFDFDPMLCQFRSPSSWYARFEVLVSHLKCLIFGVWFSGTVAVANCEVAFLIADSSLSSSFSESIVDIFEAGLESGRSCSGLEALCMYQKQLFLTKVFVTLFLPPSEGLIDGLLLAVVVSCSIRW